MIEIYGLVFSCVVGTIGHFLFDLSNKNKIVGFLFAYSLRIFGFVAFKKESLGGGDIKLSLLAGMILGGKLGIVYIIFACFLAFPYAIYLAIKNDDHMLPFGPFLIASLYIIFLHQDKFLMFINTLFGIN